MATSLGLGPEKSFKEHLQILKDMLIRGENFAFSRFSDGEIYMLQKKEIVMSPNGALVGDIKLPGNYPEDDWKHYDPEEHEFYRKKLEEAIQYKADNYYKGLSCRCCIADGEDNFKWQLDLIGPGDEHNLTWSNLFINCNYIPFLENYMPVLNIKPIVMIVNKNADIKNWGLPFQPVKDFRVGPNCISNDYHLVDEVKEWISQNDIRDPVFLFAASSLSNMIIHECYKDFPDNTYMDIGSSLNPMIPGIGSRRDYMSQLNNGVIQGEPCIW